MSDLYGELSGGTTAPKPPKPPRPRRKTKRKDLEAAVLKECMLWLIKDPRVLYVERRNTGMLEFASGGRISFGKPGAADIWCLLKLELFELDVGNMEMSGVRVSDSFLVKHVEIECKRRQGGRLSARQKDFQAHCKEIRVPYLVVTSAEALAEQIKQLTN